MGLRDKIKLSQQKPELTEEKTGKLRKVVNKASKKTEHPILTESLLKKLNLVKEGKKRGVKRTDTLIITCSKNITLETITEIDKFFPKEALTDVIAVQQFSVIYDENIKDHLHADILDCIIKLNVKRLILLLNSDTLTVSWKKDENTDSYPNYLANFIYKFSSNLQELKDDKRNDLERIYFSHILSSYNEDKTEGLLDIVSNYQAQWKGSCHQRKDLVKN